MKMTTNTKLNFYLKNFMILLVKISKTAKVDFNNSLKEKFINNEYLLSEYD